MRGLSPTWPVTGVEKKTSMVLVPTIARAEPIQYAGNATVDGISVYRFVESVPPTRFGSEQIPGSIAGIPSQAEVTLGAYYTATNTYFVDPVTGAPLNTTRSQEISFRDSSGITRLI